jgi:hypothetical protein
MVIWRDLAVENAVLGLWALKKMKHMVSISKRKKIAAFKAAVFLDYQSDVATPALSGKIFRRGPAEAMADDPQQTGAPLGKPPHVAPQQLRLRLTSRRPSSPSGMPPASCG